MRFIDFENVMTHARMSRYLAASAGNSRRAMTLYRKNLKLSQELFTVISCFEVALRNAIDGHYVATIGNNWLQNAANAGGIFDNRNCRLTQTNINDAIRKLHPAYTHNKLVAELGFGFWRYMFAHHQFGRAGRTLLAILPGKPRSTPAIQYNHTFVFNKLAAINDLRNRIAHHEPVCFLPGRPVKDTAYARQHYNQILELFHWMGINEAALLYGLDHIITVCNEIDAL
jgi:hypothetical protein